MNARYCPCKSVKGASAAVGIDMMGARVIRCGLPCKEARMNVRYVVELSEAQRTELRELVAKGSKLARKVKRAQVLLAADSGVSDQEVAQIVVVGTSTIYRTKRRFVEGGIATALHDRQRPGARRKLSGKEEALLVATACSKPPAGRARWTLELLGGELVRLTEHQQLSDETVRRRLHEKDIKPWQKKMWCVACDRWRVRRPNGGSARPLRRDAGPGTSSRLLRREPNAAHRRDAIACACGTGQARAIRL